LYSEDEYVRAKRARSVLCLPIVKRTKLVGALYLENNLTPRAFTSDRVSVLELVASQAAISLENARLYSDLQRSEAFLAQGQSISSTGSWGWSVRSGKISWSVVTFRIFEYDLTATPSIELLLRRVHPEDRALLQQVIDRASNEGTNFDTEYRLLMPDGRVKHLHVLAQAQQESSGHLEFVGAVTDITAAKQAEEKIRQSERELRQLLDNTPEHITEFGPDGSPLNNNRAALDYHGLTLEEWRRADLHRLLHPQDAERMRREQASRFLSGSSYEIEARLRRRDGQYRWFLFRFNPMLDEQGRLTRWYAAATDIEDRKQAEEKLQQSEAYLAEAQRLSHTGSWAWTTATGEIRYWSEECYRVLGFDPHGGQPLFETFFQRIHSDDRAKTRERLESARREKTEFELDSKIVHPGGETRDIRVVGHPVLSASGDLVEFVGTVIDVTERKWAEEEHARLEQRLRQAEKMEAVGRFAGGIAHDFNNILSGILAYGEMLFEEAPSDSPRKGHAQNVLTAANRGRALIEQILAYSRSQRGKRAPADIADVVAEALELVRGSLPANIRLEASPPESPLVVIGDATQLHQVVMNLCSNAIQAMSGGGMLGVALEAADLLAPRALSHGTLGSGRYVRLTVEDRGCGMDEATLSRIFEPFFTTKKIGRGTGLGLSTVYAIVADLGGAIDVKSAVNQGSTFAIYLPLGGDHFAVAVEAEDRRH
jgi:PAS domain S-box-containing protein